MSADSAYRKFFSTPAGYKPPERKVAKEKEDVEMSIHSPKESS
jgi:hypothetical protein